MSITHSRMKDSHKSYLNILTLILLAFLLCSCSTLGYFWYDRLDRSLANYFLNYIEFSNEQSDSIRSLTKDYKEWNSVYELPRYKIFMEEVLKLDEKVSVIDIKNIFDLANSLFKSSYTFFIPKTAALFKTLSDAQVEELAQVLSDHVLKMDKEWKSTKKNYNDNTV